MAHPDNYLDMLRYMHTIRLASLSQEKTTTVQTEIQNMQNQATRVLLLCRTLIMVDISHTCSHVY